MRRLLFLVIILIVGFLINYISNPTLTEYPHTISKIDSVSKKINAQVNNINYGGCGYFAYYLSELLDSLSIPYKISIINLNNTDNHITHVLLYLPEYNLFVDSRGFYRCVTINDNRFFYCSRIEQTYTKSQLRLAIYTFKWNERFNLRDTTQLKAGLRFQ